MATSKKTAKKAAKKTAKKSTAKKTAAKKAAKKTAAEKAGKKTIRVPASQVTDFVHSRGLRASGDLSAAVSTEVEAMLDRAARRTESNGRSTIRPDDL